MSADTATAPSIDRTTVDQVVREHRLKAAHMDNLVQLLAEGATVPFIARYRKERTGGMDEVKIRTLRDRLADLEDLRKRRGFILATISELGKLTPDLREQIASCQDLRALEDLYLPYKPKRLTRGKKAEQKNLTPLADLLRLAVLSGEDPQKLAAPFVAPDKEVASIEEAIAGACDILAERIADDAQCGALLRDEIQKNGFIHSRVKDDKATTAQKFRDYFDHREPLTKIPSHRVLAMRRGEHEKQLTLTVDVPQREKLLERLRRLYLGQARGKAASVLETMVKDALDRLLFPSL